MSENSDVKELIKEFIELIKSSPDDELVQELFKYANRIDESDKPDVRNYKKLLRETLKNAEQHSEVDSAVATTSKCLSEKPDLLSNVQAEIYFDLVNSCPSDEMTDELVGCSSDENISEKKKAYLKILLDVFNIFKVDFTFDCSQETSCGALAANFKTNLNLSVDKKKNNKAE